MVYVSDLADQILDKSRSGEYLLCPECSNEASANKGDYWNLEDDQKLRCASEHELIDMVLVTSQKVITVLK